MVIALQNRGTGSQADDSTLVTETHGTTREYTEYKGQQSSVKVTTTQTRYAQFHLHNILRVQGLVLPGLQGKKLRLRMAKLLTWHHRAGKWQMQSQNWYPCLHPNCPLPHSMGYAAGYSVCYHAHLPELEWQHLASGNLLPTILRGQTLPSRKEG